MRSVLPHQYVCLPPGSSAWLPCELIKVAAQAPGWAFGLPTRQPGLLICDSAVRAPKIVSWSLDLGAFPSAPVLLPGPMNLTGGDEVMARTAPRASWHDPRQSCCPVHRGQPAHSVRKRFSLLTDDCEQGEFNSLPHTFHSFSCQALETLREGRG